MSQPAAAILAAAASLGAGLLLTPRVRALAERVGLVAAPTADRWHRRPTALLGGVAIVLATLVGLGVWVAGATLPPGAGLLPVVTLPAAAVGASVAFMFGVGLLDDVFRLRAQLKFTLQTLAGVGLVAGGATLALTPWYVVNVVVTVFWFVGLTNAFNLLDNMDGVGAGVGAIAAAFLGITFPQ